MTIATRLNSRITQLAVGRHLTYRTVRVRLTLLYGALFLVSGAALMAIAYVLLINAGFVFTLDNAPVTNISGPVAAFGPVGPNTKPALPLAAARSGLAPFGARRVPAHNKPLLGFPNAGTKTHPSAQTMALWRGVTRCMHKQGYPRFPEPRASVPRSKTGIGELSDRDGAILAIPSSINMQSQAFVGAATTCAFMGADPGTRIADSRQTTQTRQTLLVQSGIALAGMSLLSLAVGWLMAGRVLQPLADSYEAQRQFVANASHELRAPLTRQRALIQVALGDPEASIASLRAAHERVLASEQHLEQIIAGLLALTRGQAGVERRERLDLAALTSEAIVARESQLQGLGVSKTLAPAPAVGDPRLLERLIANLIDNAIRHNTPGGQVEIATGTHDRRTYVSVSNTGPIVPPEQIERLFQPFERLTGARTRHDGGHGLGLSIVHAIANAHGAELTAQPRPEGGLTIEVAFPSAHNAGVSFAPAWSKRLRARARLFGAIPRRRPRRAHR